jgi:hypothetical protein
MSEIGDAAMRRLVYKEYASAIIDPTVNPDPATTPGAAGGQVIPYVPGLVMNLQRNEVASREKRADLQESDVALGIYRVPVGIPFELAPATYKAFFQGLLRNDFVSVTAFTETTFTSLAATASTSKFTLGASTWVAAGARVGMTFRPTNIAGANLGKNFTIVSLSGVDAVVYPAPADLVADTSFTVTFPGKVLQAPEANVFIRHLFCLEDYHMDADIADIATEVRFGSCAMEFPLEGPISGTWGGMGRNLWQTTAANAPLFTAPTAALGGQKIKTVGGYLLVGGVAVAYVPNAGLTIETGADGVPTGFQPTPLVAEISTGRLRVTGSINALFFDSTLTTNFKNGTEFELLIFCPVSTSAGADFISFFMPRVVLTSGSEGRRRQRPRHLFA